MTTLPPMRVSTFCIGAVNSRAGGTLGPKIRGSQDQSWHLGMSLAPTLPC